MMMIHYVGTNPVARWATGWQIELSVLIWLAIAAATLFFIFK